MSTFTPSAEQLAITSFASDRKENLLVSALAGAAKTSTLVLLAKALPRANILCLAFNKTVQEEMARRLPDNCKAMTLHSLGMMVWKQYLNLRKLNVYQGKMYGIVKDLTEELSAADKKEAYEEFAFILRSCNEAKGDGHLPDKFLVNCPKAPTPIIDDTVLLETLDEEVTQLTKSLIIRALNISAEQAMQGIIDFNDMVLFPSLFRCMYPPNNLVLVDEAQDLSPLNHRMLHQLTKKRIIAVGDQCQAIYGFRGASASGMDDIKTQFNMEELTLSCSFRCPEEIVEHVRWRAPHMTSWANTPAGGVNQMGLFNIEEIPDGAAIICRNNAPLLTLALAMLRVGKYPQIWGNDIAKNLLKILEGLGPRNMLQSDALAALATYREKQLKRVKAKKKVEDKIACLQALIETSDNLGDACLRTKEIFSTKGPIQLMTGHKSKGHEFDHVFFLDNELVTTEGQDPNLRYVICTRSKGQLTYLNSDECMDYAEEGA